MSTLRKRTTEKSEKPAAEEKEWKEKQIGEEKEAASGARWWVYVLAVVASLVVATVGTHFIAKSPIHPVEYTLPDPLPFTGPLTVNERLRSAEKLMEDQIFGAECLAVDSKSGAVYTGLRTGLICELDLNGDSPRIVRAVRLSNFSDCDGGYSSFPKCGRPLGMRVHENGDLYVIDAYLGLFVVSWKNETVRQLFPAHAAISNDDRAPPTRYLNDLDFLPDGSIVFSESSMKYDDKDYLYEILEHRPNGRLLHFFPDTEELTVLAKGLYFPNGVQVRRGKVLFSEMGKARIMVYSPSARRLSLLVDALPGYPDNIRLSNDGQLLIPIAALRTKEDNWLAQRPQLRALLTKILTPLSLQFVVDLFTQRYGLVLKYDFETGEMSESWHDATGAVSDISIAVEDGKGHLLLGNDANYYIARVTA